jgi:hypothetical protein
MQKLPVHFLGHSNPKDGRFKNFVHAIPWNTMSIPAASKAN